MKKNVVLLVDADADTASSVLEAANLTNLHVRFARTSRDFFQLIQAGLNDVAVIVLDVDPGVHGMAVLEALDAWGPAPPVIVISSLEEARLEPVTLAHGAQECFGKPVSLKRLKTALTKFAGALEARSCRCDLWGHPCKGCTEHRPATNERESACFA
jgi:DNA-binding NtrC family response regulator